jgi:hypothetical protein
VAGARRFDPKAAAMTIDHIVEAGHVIIEPLHDPRQQPSWMQSASNDLLATGTERVFDQCECGCGGRS